MLSRFNQPTERTLEMEKQLLWKHLNGRQVAEEGGDDDDDGGAFSQTESKSL